MKKRKRQSAPPRRPPEIRPAEEILIEAVAELPAGSILCTSLGRGQFAAAAAQAQPSAAVRCSFLDLFACDQAEKFHAPGPPNLRFECAADFPEDEVDVFALPVTAAGDGELVRDFLQAGHRRLRTGGLLLAATDNPQDSWLHDELRKHFAKVTRRPGKRGTLYVAAKTEPLPKIKNHGCRFVFRDQEHLIQAVSRPGVFSHRRVDGGARALMRAATVRSGDRVLELGAGSGVVSMALAMRSPGVDVLAIDSNARAIQCTQLGLEANGLSNVRPLLSTAESADSGEIAADSFDLVVANPPYFSNYRIAEIFARCASRALKPGGTVFFVAKRAEWYVERLPALFDSVSVEPSGKYVIVRGCGIQPHE